jgi:DnaJ-class molecular chaperone
MNDKEYEQVYCSHCSGSGEGMYDGSTCWACHGKGEVWVEMDPEPEESEDE